MSIPLPEIYLARHGETAWTISHQHTGRADIPLTERGERNARSLGERLRGTTFARVFTSPLVRSRRTAELAGFGAVAQADPDLMEWDYGLYDGKTTAEIRKENPDWSLFRDGCPGGESVVAVECRADRVVARLRPIERRVLLSRAGRALAGADCRRRTLILFEHGVAQCARLRAFPGRTRHPPLER